MFNPMSNAFQIWHNLIAISCTMAPHCTLRIPRIFPGAPLTFNGAPWNFQGNFTGMQLQARALIPSGFAINPSMSFSPCHCFPVLNNANFCNYCYSWFKQYPILLEIWTFNDAKLDVTPSPKCQDWQCKKDVTPHTMELRLSFTDLGK